MMKAWEKNIRTVTPYVPGDQPQTAGIIKLNTNENPYPPSPAVAATLKEIDADKLRLYPDTTADMLVSQIASCYQLEKDQIFVGVGSDDVLALCFLTFFNSNKPILFPDITYSFYDVWADLFRIPYQCQPLDYKLTLNEQDYERENGGIIFPNPNAPTGICLDLEAIETIIAHNQDVVVIVDEAYIDFGGTSAVELIHKYENVLVVQTFSKSRSMAGIRIGYAMGSKTLISYLKDVKFSFNSYTLNLPSIILGTEALKDEEYFHIITEKIIATRERTSRELKKMGFRMPDSKANFLFVTHEKYAAKDLYEALKENNIYVRYFNKPRIDNYLRITIGTDEQIDTLLAFLRRYMEEHPI